MPFPLMIFAAGFGTRMGALAAERPKPLIDVAGETLLDRALALGREAAARPIVVNAHYRAGMIATHLAGAADVRLSFERPEILDTGGGLRAALPLLGAGPAMTLNPDVVWTGANPLSVLARAWDGTRMEALLMLVPRDHARAHAGSGDFAIDGAGRLTRATGKADALVYTGAQILRTEALAAIPDRVFSLNRLWDAMLARGCVFGLVHTGGWADVGSPAGVAAAEAMLAEADDG